MTDNTQCITEAAALHSLTLQELLKQGYLLTKERDRHSRKSIAAHWNRKQRLQNIHSTKHGELDVLIVEYQRVLAVRLRHLSRHDVFAARERVANELQCLPGDERRQFARYAIAENINTQYPKATEFERMHLHFLFREGYAMEQERTKQDRAVHNYRFNLAQHPGDIELTQEYEKAQDAVVRIERDLDSYQAVVHHRVGQMPLAQILAAIKAPRAQPEDPFQQFVRRGYIDCLEEIGHTKFAPIRSWENQVATRELSEDFPSLFELEAVVQFWREWAVLQQVEENLPYLARHTTALANAYADRFEAVVTGRRAMEEWRLVLATGLHRRLGEGSSFRTLDSELVKMVVELAFPPAPPPEGA